MKRHRTVMFGSIQTGAFAAILGIGLNMPALAAQEVHAGAVGPAAVDTDLIDVIGAFGRAVREFATGLEAFVCSAIRTGDVVRSRRERQMLNDLSGRLGRLASRNYILAEEIERYMAAPDDVLWTTTIRPEAERLLLEVQELQSTFESLSTQSLFPSEMSTAYTNLFRTLQRRGMTLNMLIAASPPRRENAAAMAQLDELRKRLIQAAEGIEVGMIEIGRYLAALQGRRIGCPEA